MPARATPPEASGRLLGLDLLRAASILPVLVGHVLVADRLRDGAGFTLLQRVSRGHFGVCVFFVVSGFIITRTTLDRTADPRDLGLRDFYARRIARLAPLALVVLGVGAVLYAVVPLGAARDEVLAGPGARFDLWFVVSFPALLFNILRVEHFRVASGWGIWWDVFWSLAIEEQFYVLYPLVVRRYGMARRLMAILVAVVVTGGVFVAAAVLINPDNLWLALLSSPPGFALIAMGCLLAIALEHHPLHLGRLAASGSVGAAALVAAWVFATADLRAGSWSILWGPAAMGLAAILGIVGLLDLIRAGRWAMLFALPGELSYGMYLLHGAVLLAMWPLLPGLPPVASLAAFIVLVLVVALVSHHAFERPMQRLVRARLARWVAAEPRPAKGDELLAPDGLR